MTKAGKGSDFSEMNDMEDEQLPTIELFDEAGRSLTCYVEQTLEVDDVEYLLLLPVDSPIEIFAWVTEDDDEEVETMVDLADEDVDAVFDTAKAVLAEQDLVLKRTAYTLSVSGDLPDVEEEDIITLDVGEDESSADPNQSEQFQRLAYFYHEDQEYEVCTPLDPLLFFARRDSEGEAKLLSPEEFQAVRPQLEAQLFDALE